jgi:endonuclease/exonuclease/phosphatase family metal-dependent hydrolase
MPRALFLIPIAVLALASAWARRPSQWVFQGVLAVLVAGPLMGFAMAIPIRPEEPAEQGTRLRILCFNRGLLPLDDGRLFRLIERERVDLICFQEGADDDHVVDAYFRRGWYHDRTGFVISRYPIVSEWARWPDRFISPDRASARLARARIRTETGAEFVLASVHLPTLRLGFEQFLAGNVAGLSRHIAWWDSEFERVVQGLSEVGDTPLLVGGDFNMPADNSKMAALQHSLRFGFEAAGRGYGFTRPTQHPWVRIDHIAASREWVFTRCWVGPDCGSDHLPLLAEVILPAKASTKKALPQ